MNMQSPTEKPALNTADLSTVGLESTRCSKKRPLATGADAMTSDMADSERSNRPLKKRWSSMSTTTEADTSTAAAAAYIDESASLTKSTSDSSSFNPLALLSEASATAAMLEKKGDPLAHYLPRICSNLPPPADESLASTTPAHVMLQNQIARRRQMLARLQNVCGYQKPGISAQAIKLPSWQQQPAEVPKVQQPEPETTKPSPAAPEVRDVVEEKKPKASPKKVAAKKPAPEATKTVAAKKKTAPAAESKKKAAPAVESKKTAKIAPKPAREYNYKPLGGRHYCWM